MTRFGWLMVTYFWLLAIGASAFIRSIASPMNFNAGPRCAASTRTKSEASPMGTHPSR